MDDTRMPQMAVAIINYNTCDYLRTCLASVVSACAGPIIVVDNASSDGSVDMVRELFPQVTLYANRNNRGFGAACNQAIAHCTTPYVLLLNSDTVLGPGTIDVLADYLDHNPQVGIVGPRLLNVDGSLQPSCFPFPTPLNIALELSNLSSVTRFLPGIRQLYLRSWSHDYPRAVPWVLGAALAIRRAAFEAVGGFDESFFMYSEEIDLCYRMRPAGWQTHFTPAGAITHTGGASTSQYRVDMAVRLFQSWRAFYDHHYSRYRLLELRLIIGAGVGAKIARDQLRLFYASDPLARHRLAENIRIWRQVLADLRQPFAGAGAATSGEQL
jgi:N-acetylglucosaminyl-diphospho-decaprenol L-rhamnosyltransferase